ncbi:MAG: adenylate kinase [Thermogemmata sp.]|jgi:adenylate kinase|uniref:Adenylate kinase n=1 Tax=Thermogemmata fonticola TaxID=2755323 RepID=A0A7V8VCY8_9BACT|nr:adenylate kinase [Thermogemmata fonticola]MBA2225705.1 adenylate kinase [Thermogemmata fonticola]MCX8140526.1 adenylate kinase [Gemmataceae bacterium]GIW85659.1 MAG: adenylate kinase [Gemmataceae bacterium]
MRLVLVGPPGSGKGTQARRLAERLGLTYIGTGDMLREAIAQGSERGRRVADLIKQGLLVPDAEVNALIAELFQGPQRPRCFVTDGYPRTRAQAEAFDQLLARLGLPLDAVINLTIPDEEVVRRIAGRRCCTNSACGICYNIYFQPPRQPGVCDKCGSPLAQRDDDREETVRRRLQEFHKTTDALLEHYRQQGLVRDVSAVDHVETIYANILQAARPPDGHQAACPPDGHSPQAS